MGGTYQSADEARRGTRNLFFYSVGLLALGVVFALSSFFLNGIADQSAAQWLQRSGAVLTALSAWAVALNEITSRKLWVPGTYANAELLPVYDKYKPCFGRVRAAGITLSIFGTIVWGYADLWF